MFEKKLVGPFINLKLPFKKNFRGYLNLRCFLESENILGKVLPIRRHAVDIGWTLLVPSFGETHMCQHFFSVRTVFRTPSVSIEGGVDTLSLIDESVATRLSFRPSIQSVPAPTHASLMEASILVFRHCGIHGRVVCVA